ncbi:hypothetical protein ACV35E_32665, partial [Pseudomonas aeruginosa]
GVAQDAVRALDNLRQSIRERDEDAQRRIRFCAPHILSSVFFPHWIPRLQARNPVREEHRGEDVRGAETNAPLGVFVALADRLAQVVQGAHRVLRHA